MPPFLTNPSEIPTLFATTRWTVIAEAAEGEKPEAIAALGQLAQTYWIPLYRYARRKGNSREDAEDLVQGFLLQFITKGALSHVDKTKGRFRAFLLASFNHWSVNEWKRATCKKRGGTQAPLSLDWEQAETGLSLDGIDDRSPDRLFDREWALALLENVLQDLETAARAEGTQEQFEQLKSCLTLDSDRIGYADLAKDLGMTEGALRVAVHRLRKRYRAQIKEEVARTLADPNKVEEEMEALFAALSDYPQKSA